MRWLEIYEFHDHNDNKIRYTIDAEGNVNIISEIPRYWKTYLIIEACRKDFEEKKADEINRVTCDLGMDRRNNYPE